MRVFALVFMASVFGLGVVAMRSEVNRSGRAISRLHEEVSIKEARNQYLKLETQRLSGPDKITHLAQEKLKLYPTLPSQVIQLED